MQPEKYSHFEELLVRNLRGVHLEVRKLVARSLLEESVGLDVGLAGKESRGTLVGVLESNVTSNGARLVEYEAIVVLQAPNGYRRERCDRMAAMTARERTIFSTKFIRKENGRPRCKEPVRRGSFGGIQGSFAP